MQDIEEDNGIDDSRLKSPHVSPTLKHINKEEIGEPGPDAVVACRDCPVSIWYWRGSSRIFCFCSAMHEQTWGSGEEPILFCDAREQEVARLIAMLASAAPIGTDG